MLHSVCRACASGEADELRSLIVTHRGRIDLSGQLSEAVVSSFERDGSRNVPLTLLGVAAQHDSADCICVLLESRASLNTHETHGEGTSLMLASEELAEKAVQVLLEAAPASVNSTDECGQSPLYHAAAVMSNQKVEGPNDVVPMLLAAGADVDAQNWHGTAPLPQTPPGKPPRSAPDRRLAH